MSHGWMRSVTIVPCNRPTSARAPCAPLASLMMDTQTLHDRRGSTTRWLSVSALALSSLTLLLTLTQLFLPAPPRVGVLRAQVIELVDSRGHTRARWSTAVDGGCLITMAKPNDELGVIISSSGEGVSLTLSDGDSKSAIVLQADSSGGNTRLYGPSNSCIEITNGPNGVRITKYDRRGNAVKSGDY
jgi:hypothetical protein